ncbi:MAG: cell envelope integrity protein TolA [Marinomonas colpomeniae]
MNWFKDDGYGIPVLLAIGIHAGIILTGIIAVDLSDNETQKPKVPVIVNATIIDISDTVIGKRESQEKEAKRQDVAAKKKRKEEAAKKVKRNTERKALEEKQKKQAQAKAKAEEAAKKEAQKKKAADEVAAKKENEGKQAAEKKRLAQDAEKKRLEKQAADAKKIKEQELLDKIEADRLANEERKRQEEAKKVAEQKRQAEEAAAQAAEKERAAAEAQMVQSISSLINSRVTLAWNRPPSARNGMKTKLRINFFPTGEINNAQVTESSGDALFDQRTLDAVYRVKKIEELADIDSITFERNFRQVDLIFNPQDLRN